MKKAVVTVIVIVLAVLLTSAFTISALWPSAGADRTPPPEGDAGGEDPGTLPAAPNDRDTLKLPGVEDRPTEPEAIAPSVPVDPETARAEAAVIMEKLGIMYGVGTLEDGTPDYALDKTLTRIQAMTFVARAMGYVRDGVNGDYPHDFTDVPDWASGSVGFSFRHGITTGSGAHVFGAQRDVTGRELVTFALRGLGYGQDFNWEEACAFSDELGLTYGELGDGVEPITRGETAEIIVRMLETRPKDGSDTFLSRLVDAGIVSREKIDELELSQYVNISAGTGYTAAKALEDYGGAAVNVLPRDIMLKSMPTVHGFIIARDTVAVPLSAIKGASYITLTSMGGADLGYKGVIGCDEELGIAYLACTVEAPEWVEKAWQEKYPAEEPQPGEPDATEPGDLADTQPAAPAVPATPTEPAAPAEPQTPTVEPGDIVYIVSDMAVANAYGSDAWNQALVMVSDSGELMGITTLTGPAFPEPMEGEPRELYDVGLELWPELCPPVRPRGIDPTKPMTAITYDDGPSKTYTPMLLDLLEKYHTVATFFEVGTMVKSNPQFLTRMEAMGCEIGNHSWDHSNLKKLTAQGVRSQIERTEELIRSYTGHDVALVRCPGGNSNATVAANVGHPMIYWTIDTRDWEHRNASKVISSIQNDKNLDGDIILMHSLYKSTYDASVTIIPWIINKGYQPVTVSELAFFRGVELQNGVVYYKFPPQ